MSSMEDFSEEEEIVEEVSETSAYEEEFDEDSEDVLEEGDEVVNDQGNSSNESRAGDEYDEQVVESIFDLKEDPKTPEEYEAQVRQLIPIVYHDQGVDPDAMIRRSPVLAELYIYLKQMYWYEKHSGKVVEEEVEEEEDEQNEGQGISVMEMFARRALMGGSSGEKDSDESEASDDNDSDGVVVVEEDETESEIEATNLQDFARAALGVEEGYSSQTNNEASFAMNESGSTIAIEEESFAELSVARSEYSEEEEVSETAAEHVESSEGCRKHDRSLVETICTSRTGDDSSASSSTVGDSVKEALYSEHGTAITSTLNHSLVDDSTYDDDDETEEEEAEAAEEYDEQVVESIFDLKEDPKTPEEYEAQVRQLIPIVYHGQGVDPDAMMRRSPVLAELYTYLKQMYWYEKHSGKVVEEEVEEEEAEQSETQGMSIMEIFARRALTKSAGETGSESIGESSFSQEESVIVVEEDHNSVNREPYNHGDVVVEEEVVEDEDETTEVVEEEEEIVVVDESMTEYEEYDDEDSDENTERSGNSMVRSADLLLKLQQDVQSLQLQ